MAVDKIVGFDASNGRQEMLELGPDLKVVGNEAHALSAFPCQGRLTLATGQPDYCAERSLLPSSTNTTADTVDFAVAHGWVTGTIVRITFTVGGLTADTNYYIRAIDSDTIAFYTTRANAFSDTSRVNLTASITQQIEAIGVANTTLYFSPYNGNRITLYDGTNWKLYSFSEVSLSLSLTSGTNYDVYIFDSSGTLTLETTAWSSDTARATDLTTQDGVAVKTGATTRRYLGTIRASATNEVEDSAEKRFLWNEYNRLRRLVFKYEETDSWSYGTDTWRPFNGDSANKVAIVQGRRAEVIDLKVFGIFTQDVTLGSMSYGIGVNSTSLNSSHMNAYMGFDDEQAAPIGLSSAYLTECPRLGFTEYTALETNWISLSCTNYGKFDDVTGGFVSNLLRRTGIQGTWRC